jgi:hypothetical protein
MRKLSAILMIASLVWVVGLTAGASATAVVPGTGDGAHSAIPGLPLIPFGDDGGGSHE